MSSPLFLRLQESTENVTLFTNKILIFCCFSHHSNRQLIRFNPTCPIAKCLFSTSHHSEGESCLLLSKISARPSVFLSLMHFNEANPICCACTTNRRFGITYTTNMALQFYIDTNEITTILTSVKTYPLQDNKSRRRYTITVTITDAAT